MLRLAAELDIPTEVADFSLPELHTADEAFATGTMGELAPVVEVDGRTIGDGSAGPLTRQLTEAFADLVAKAGTQVV